METLRKLKVEELFVGAWVQERLFTDRFSPPMFVYAVWRNGDLYLNIDENEGDPFETHADNIYGLPLDDGVLEGFGFRKSRDENVWRKDIADVHLTVSLRWRHGAQECRRVAIGGRFTCWNEEIRCVHELQRWWNEKMLLPHGMALDLRWVGIKKEQ